MKTDGGGGNARGKHVNTSINIYNVVYHIGYDDAEFTKFTCNTFNK